MAAVAVFAVVASVFLCFGYLFYMAPVILSEIALETAIMIGIVKSRISANDFATGSWLLTAMKKTWLIYLLISLLVVVGTLIMQHYFPNDKTIFDMITHVKI